MKAKRCLCLAAILAGILLLSLPVTQDSQAYVPVGIKYAQAGPFCDVAISPDGSVLLLNIEDSYVQVLSPALQNVRRFGSKGDQPGQFSKPSGITVDGEGNVYVADTDNNRVQKFTPEGAFLLEFGRAEGDLGKLDKPTAVAVDLFGRVFVVNSKKRRIEVFNSEGIFLDVLGEPRKGGGWSPFNLFGGDDTPVATEEELVTFAEPVDVAVDRTGSVYVLDSEYGLVQMFNPGLKFVGTFGGDGPWDGPGGLCIREDGLLLIADTKHHTVSVLNRRDREIVRFGSKGSGRGQFEEPKGIAVGSDSLIFVADPKGKRVQAFVVPDLPERRPRGVNMTAPLPPRVELVAHIRSKATGLAYGPGGVLAAVDSKENVLHLFQSDGKKLFQVGKNGKAPAEFSHPQGCAIRSDGIIVVADAGNNRVQVFSADGVFLGEKGTKGTMPGEFDSPYDVAVAPDGGFYIADRNNDRVQRFDESGEYLSELGPAAGQALERPERVAVDPQGNVYVTEPDRNRVQAFSADGDLIFSLDENQAKALGLEGPIGIDVNEEGYLLLLDRSGRVLVYGQSGERVFSFGCSGSLPSQVKDPKGLVAGPSGLMAIADQGNERITIFRLSSLRSGAVIIPIPGAGELSAEVKLLESSSNTAFTGEPMGSEYFIVTGLAPGTYNLSIASATCLPIESTTPIEVHAGRVVFHHPLELKMAGAIKGSIRPAVSWARVNLIPTEGEMCTVAVSPDGSFSASQLRPGHYAVSVEAEGYVPDVEMVGVEVEEGGTASLPTIDLIQPGAIVGLVQPLLPTVMVNLVQSGEIVATTMASPTFGNFRLDPVRPGFYQIEIIALGAAAPEPEDVTLRSGETLFLEPMSLGGQRPGRLEGRVQPPQPGIMALVWVDSLFLAAVQVDSASGDFSLKEAPPGIYDVIVGSDRFSPRPAAASRPLLPGQTLVLPTVALAPADTTPTAWGMAIMKEDSDNGVAVAIHKGRIIAVAPIDPHGGRFTFRELAVDRLTVTLNSPHHVSQKLEPVVIPPGEERVWLGEHLMPPRRVAGSIAGVISPPPRYATVDLLQNQRLLGSVSVGQGKGGFHFEDVTPGPYELRIAGEGYTFSPDRLEITVEVGQEAQCEPISSISSTGR